MSAKNDKKFSEETVRKERTFPVGYTVLLVICVLAQIFLIVGACMHDPKPQDRIDRYEVTVIPQRDGTLEITYTLVWTPLDEEEPLTWVELGLANANFAVYEGEYSSNISRLTRYTDDGGYVSLRLHLDRAYHAGETLEFSVTVTQRDMLCMDETGYFYEFVPGWFNATPVEQYEFRWLDVPGLRHANTDSRENGYYVWKGAFACGGYEKMAVSYTKAAFSGANVTADYAPFDDSGCYDELESDKHVLIAICVMLCLGIGIIELYAIDSYVSYHRGRGFLVGYGHHVHHYGRVNPLYRTAYNKHSSSRGGRGGGGCACACACACAGGGRAGCSQKDAYYKK